MAGREGGGSEVGGQACGAVVESIGWSYQDVCMMYVMSPADACLSSKKETSTGGKASMAER